MTTMLNAPHHHLPHEVLDEVTIRFAGDSGDGMQLTGDQFTTTSALIGNDLSTLPDFPAEIRAPSGTLPGVSGFQVHIADHRIYTPGDQLDGRQPSIRRRRMHVQINHSGASAFRRIAAIRLINRTIKRSVAAPWISPASCGSCRDDA